MNIFSNNVLAGKSVLVTGGGSGLGSEIARALAGHGATVHICGRRQALLDETAARISAETGGRVVAHACDIRDADAVDAMIEAIWQDGPLPTVVALEAIPGTIFHEVWSTEGAPAPVGGPKGDSWRTPSGTAEGDDAGVAGDFEKGPCNST